MALGLLAIVLGLVFRTQNVAYKVGMAFSVAASANFPVLLLAIVTVPLALVVTIGVSLISRAAVSGPAAAGFKS